MRRRRERGGRATARRSGPPGEVPWWDPDQQALVERPLLDRRVLGRGWIDAPMVNNVELLDPLGDDEASACIHDARRARVLVALDDGRAWRHRDGRGLVVQRVERYADRSGDATAHRAAWQAHGRAALEATWRQRWQERDVVAGWIEARAVPPAERPDPLHAFAEAPLPAGAPSAVDWFRVEDHTDPARVGDVVLFQHVTIWRGSAQVTLTVRHPLGEPLEELVARTAAVVHDRLPA